MDIVERTFYLSKYLRVIGALRGESLPFYGIPNYSCIGNIPGLYFDREKLLQIVKENPELHIASSFDSSPDRNDVNYYDPEATSYYLCEGDADPNIRGILEMDPKHLTPEAILEIQNIMNMMTAAIERKHKRKA